MAAGAFQGAEQVAAALDGDLRREDAHQHLRDEHLRVVVEALAPAGQVLQPGLGLVELGHAQFLGGLVVALPPGLGLAVGKFGEVAGRGGHLRAGVALLSTVIPYAMELQARRTLKAATFSILMSMEPAAAALFAWIVLGEWLNWPEWLAMAAVIIASIGAIRTARR